VISVKHENMPASPVNGQHPSEGLPKYDPSVTYILEFCTILATRDAETIEKMGKMVFDTLQDVLRDSSQHHAITISRATFYALQLLKASYVSCNRTRDGGYANTDEKDHDFVNVPFLLHTISSLSQDALGKTSDLALAGLAICIDEPGPLRREIMTSPDFWAILRTLAGRPESAALVFGILERGITGDPQAILADNYEAAVLLLNDFATAANPNQPSLQRTGSRQQQQRPPQQKKGAKR
jgi:brefeldin A-resistance guanine nucleotide exchange factor 1